MSASLGYHTFTIFKRLTYDEAVRLYNDFKRFRDKTGEIKIITPNKEKKSKINDFPSSYTIIYLQRHKGISWYIRFSNILSHLVDRYNPKYHEEPQPYSVRAKINPKSLTGTKDYFIAANSECLDSVEAIFNGEASRISPIINNFDSYGMNRTDYCLNADLRELNLPCTPEQMMKLIKRGDLLRHYTEYRKYNKKAHRWVSNKYALYLQSNSSTVNCYWKYPQLVEEFGDCSDIEDSRHIIRFEIQCKYTKVYAMSKIFREQYRKKLSLDEIYDSIVQGKVNYPCFINELLSDNIANDIIYKYFYKVIRKGNYFTLDGARWIIKKHNFRLEKETRLLETIEFINECRGIAKAKEKLHDAELSDFKRTLKDLDDILVNPVTIPRDWGINYIPNLLRAYEDYYYVERLITKKEFIANKIISEYRTMTNFN